MDEFKYAIKREQRRIQRLIELTNQYDHIDNLGTLILDRRETGIYCFERRDNTKKYLGKLDSEAAKACAKDHFIAEKRKRLLLDKALLTKFEKQYKYYDYESVFAALSKPYRAVIGENYIDERYEEIKQWANTDYRKNQAPFPDAEIYAIDGTRVRSKGECLHLNILINMGIPYRYDSVITITDGRGNTKNVSPDIMIQNYDYSLTIIEHLGRLFDKRYALDVGEKCYWYLQDGFILGKNYFVTSDDIFGGTDTRSIQDVAKLVWQRFISEALCDKV